MSTITRTTIQPILESVPLGHPLLQRVGEGKPTLIRIPLFPSRTCAEFERTTSRNPYPLRSVQSQLSPFLLEGASCRLQARVLRSRLSLLPLVAEVELRGNWPSPLPPQAEVGLRRNQLSPLPPQAEASSSERSNQPSGLRLLSQSSLSSSPSGSQDPLHSPLAMSQMNPTASSTGSFRLIWEKRGDYLARSGTLSPPPHLSQPQA